jgi:hypothetical protein
LRSLGRSAGADCLWRSYRSSLLLSPGMDPRKRRWALEASPSWGHSCVAECWG